MDDRSRSMDSATSSSATTLLMAIDLARRHLVDAGSSTPRLDAEVLLRHVLGLDRTRLIVHLHEPLASSDLDRYLGLVGRRAAGEPVAYLTGEREFMGLAFVVRSGVLIPRPETELLVEWALSRLRDLSVATVLDVGTGSGAIALSLASHRPPSRHGRILASDISSAALRVAAENRSRLGVVDRVDLVQGDLGSWCAEPVDLLLANLPYLRPDQLTDNLELVAEPRLALAGGVDGLDLVRQLLADTPRLLAPGGALALEIDPSQVGAARELAGAALSDGKVTVQNDLAGLPRIVIADRAG